MKLVLRSLILVCFYFASLFGNAQSNHSFEFEVAPILSNRIITGSTNSSQYQIDKYKSQSKIISGFYLQFGANFREQKRTRLYTGLRLLNQQVMVSYFSIYNQIQDPDGNWSLSGLPLSERTDMLYLSIPLALKHSLINMDSFRMVGELGLAPGVFIGAFPTQRDAKRISLSTEFALSFEWKLESGNTIGFKFPSINYSVLPNTITHGDIKQNNYSLGLGLKFGLAQINNAT